MAKTSYAKAMEMVAAKKGKYEKQLEQAKLSSDRFSMNSAQRSLDRIIQYEQELFDSQEQQKVDKGITPSPQMRYGGIPMYVGGGSYSNPPLPNLQGMSFDQLNQLFNQVKADPNYNTYAKDKNLSAIRQQMNVMEGHKDINWAPFQSPDYSFKTPSWLPTNVAVPGDEQQVSTPAASTTGGSGNPGDTREVVPLLQLKPKSWASEPTPLAPPTLVTGPATSSVQGSQTQSGSPSASQGFSGLGDMFGKAQQLAPYALQFAPDLYALNQLKKLERPVDAPMERATLMNTDIDTSATRARIMANAAAYNAGVDSSMSNSAAVQNVKLANLAQTNRQMADIGQQEANQETALRNQQAASLTNTMNRNLAIDAANRRQLTDFNNMITNARLGIVQGMGTKAFQMQQEGNQMQLDRERLDTLKRQFDPGVIQRNFQNIMQDDPTNMSEADLQSLAQSIRQYPSLGLQLQADNPKLYDTLIKLG